MTAVMDAACRETTRANKETLLALASDAALWERYLGVLALHICRPPRRDAEGGLFRCDNLSALNCAALAALADPEDAADALSEADWARAFPDAEVVDPGLCSAAVRWDADAQIYRADVLFPADALSDGVERRRGLPDPIDLDAPRGAELWRAATSKLALLSPRLGPGGRPTSPEPGANEADPKFVCLDEVDPNVAAVVLLHWGLEPELVVPPATRDAAELKRYCDLLRKDADTLVYQAARAMREAEREAKVEKAHAHATPAASESPEPVPGGPQVVARAADAGENPAPARKAATYRPSPRRAAEAVATAKAMAVRKKG